MKTFCSVAIALAVTCFFGASNLYGDVVIDNINFRNNGPFQPDVTASLTTIHSQAPLVTSFTAMGLDIDQDGTVDPNFTFEVVFSSLNADGVSLWGQGVSNTFINGAGNAAPFEDIQDISVSVQNVVGTTSLGETVVFGGFAGVGIGTFDFSGNNAGNQAALINGIFHQVNQIGSGSGFGGVTELLFAAGSRPLTLDFENAAVTNGFAQAGSRSIRTLDLKFLSEPVPEPSSAALLAIAGLGLIRRRR